MKGLREEGLPNQFVRAPRIVGSDGMPAWDAMLSPLVAGACTLRPVHLHVRVAVTEVTDRKAGS